MFRQYTNMTLKPKEKQHILDDLFKLFVCSNDSIIVGYYSRYILVIYGVSYNDEHVTVGE